MFFTFILTAALFIALCKFNNFLEFFLLINNKFVVFSTRPLLLSTKIHDTLVLFLLILLLVTGVFILGRRLSITVIGVFFERVQRIHTLRGVRPLPLG